jgi:hypothetical protein
MQGIIRPVVMILLVSAVVISHVQHAEPCNPTPMTSNALLSFLPSRCRRLHDAGSDTSHLYISLVCILSGRGSVSGLHLQALVTVSPGKIRAVAQTDVAAGLAAQRVRQCRMLCMHVVNLMCCWQSNELFDA